MPSFPRGVHLLMTVVLCSAAANLDPKKQKEVEGATGGRPEKPQNLQVIPETSSSIVVMWDKPSSDADVDHYLVYVENEHRVNTSDVNYYVWEDLEACRNYTFGVRAVSAKGNMSEPALGDGVTKTEVPPAPNLDVQSFTSTTITVTVYYDTLCPIVEFDFAVDEEKSLSQEAQEYYGNAHFTNLKPNTTYTITSSASNSAGRGPSTTIHQTTAPDSGGPPRHLVAEGIHSSAVNVSWSAPYTEPLYYLVSALPCMYSEEIVYGLTYLIKDLDPCQCCFITVTSYYSSTLSFSAETLASTTDCCRP